MQNMTDQSFIDNSQSSTMPFDPLCVLSSAGGHRLEDSPMPVTNTAWHQAHRMPKNPSLSQRIAWHQEHAKHCACRPMPASIAQALRAQAVSQAGSNAS